MTQDSVDNLLIQWAEERPGLALEGLGAVVRIGRLAALWTVRADDALTRLGLSLWEYDVLSALRRQGPPFQLTASELAAETMISSGAITNRVDRLVDKSLVSRESDADDRRAVIVRLTPDGRRLIAEAVEARVAVADACLAALDAGSRKRLDHYLRQLLNDAEVPPDNTD